MKAVIPVVVFIALFSGATAQTVPVMLRLTPGISSDSALSIMGAAQQRDTTWTGTVNRRIEKIAVYHVSQYRIVGEMHLTLDKYGKLKEAFWLGGRPPQRTEEDWFSPTTELTAEDAESVRDSLTVHLGEHYGSETFWIWRSGGRSFYLSLSDSGLSMGLSPAERELGGPRKKKRR